MSENDARILIAEYIKENIDNISDELLEAFTMSLSALKILILIEEEKTCNKPYGRGYWRERDAE